jgi:membrane protein YdbS with pleckstrin-like domain
MTDDLSGMKQRFVTMMVADLVLMAVAAAFAVAYFAKGVDWAIWGFVGFLAAAFVAQMWFVRGFARAKKGS